MKQLETRDHALVVNDTDGGRPVWIMPLAMTGSRAPASDEVFGKVLCPGCLVSCWRSSRIPEDALVACGRCAPRCDSAPGSIDHGHEYDLDLNKYEICAADEIGKSTADLPVNKSEAHDGA